MEDKDIIFNSARMLLDIGQLITPIDKRIGEMCLFLSDRTLSIGEERGYHLKQDEKCDCKCKESECSNNPKSPLENYPLGSMDDPIPTIENQSTMCNGHSNFPTPKSESVKDEVRNLVEKIRSESKNA